MENVVQSVQPHQVLPQMDQADQRGIVDLKVTLALLAFLAEMVITETLVCQANLVFLAPLEFARVVEVAQQVVEM